MPMSDKTPTPRERAHELAQRWLPASCGFGVFRDEGHSEACEKITAAIEAVVAAERERCAAEKAAAVEAMRERCDRIARAHVNTLRPGFGGGHPILSAAYNKACEEIAADIRAPK